MFCFVGKRESGPDPREVTGSWELGKQEAMSLLGFPRGLSPTLCAPQPDENWLWMLMDPGYGCGLVSRVKGPVRGAQRRMLRGAVRAIFVVA